MNLMMCMRGEVEQHRFLPEIAELGAGIELGSFGMIGIRSQRDWQERLALHKAVREQFHGTVALHGPFIGMTYGHIDCLIRDAVNRRLDMIFDVAMQLEASRVILHSGYGREIELFKFQQSWLKGNIEFWKREIVRWTDAGIQIVIENETEALPGVLVELVNGVDSPFMGLCFDIGHQHMFSQLDAVGWVRQMAGRLLHVHLHDNDRTGDHHWPIGRGTIHFESFYSAIAHHAPQATLSIEVMNTPDVALTPDLMGVTMGDLRKLAARFHPKWDEIERGPTFPGV